MHMSLGSNLFVIYVIDHYILYKMLYKFNSLIIRNWESDDKHSFGFNVYHVSFSYIKLLVFM